MKKQQVLYVFVDDGYPEASDYDSNYVCYEPAVPRRYERAMEESRSHRLIPTEPTTGTGTTLTVPLPSSRLTGEEAES